MKFSVMLFVLGIVFLNILFALKKITEILLSISNQEDSDLCNDTIIIDN